MFIIVFRPTGQADWDWAVANEVRSMMRDAAKAVLSIVVIVANCVDVDRRIWSALEAKESS